MTGARLGTGGGGATLDSVSKVALDSVSKVALERLHLRRLELRFKNLQVEDKVDEIYNIVQKV